MSFTKGIGISHEANVFHEWPDDCKAFVGPSMIYVDSQRCDSSHEARVLIGWISWLTEGTCSQKDLRRSASLQEMHRRMWF